MKRSILLSVGAVLLTVWLVAGGGCGEESGETNKTAGAVGVINISYVNSYNDLEELAAAVDLIIAGTVTETEAIAEDSSNDIFVLHNTCSVIRADRVVKGTCADEITVIQQGAEGYATEVGNPPFKTGEQVFLFLREDESGTYHLPHPNGRFAIEDNKVSSLNYVLPIGQSHPPIDLIFWHIELDRFLEKVETVLKQQITIPDEKPVFSFSLNLLMSGQFDTLSVYSDGFVLYTKVSGMRMVVASHPPTKEWRTGQLSEQNMNDLAVLVQSDEFSALDDDYKFEPVEKEREDGSSYFTMGDMTCQFVIDYAGITRTITTSQYIHPVESDSYPDMPYPLNDLYTLLRGFGENQTKIQLVETDYE